MLYYFSCLDGKLKMVIQGLDTPNLFDEDTQKDRRATIANYFVGHINTHSSYIYKFIVCEFLNLVNIVGQVRINILKVCISILIWAHRLLTCNVIYFFIP